MSEPDTDDASTESNQHQKYFDDQFDDEEVMLVFRQHPIVMRKGLVFGMLGPLLGVIPAAVKPSLGFGWFFGGLVAGIVLGLLIFARPWVGWYFSLFILTDQRFIQMTQRGLFHRSVADISLHQIQSINYEIDGLEQTLLGFGTIKMQTYVGDLLLRDIHHPAKTQRRIAEILRQVGVTANTEPINARVQHDST
jgi:uncharacterized membrane protein YdbT with pleckstrin-like domain